MNREILANRLMDLVILIFNAFEESAKSPESYYFKDLAFCASSSAVLNYSEAQRAESRMDFIHKCSLVLKELREAYASMKILKKD